MSACSPPGCTALGWPGLQTSEQWFWVGHSVFHQTCIRFRKHDQSPHVASCCIPARVRSLVSILQLMPHGGWTVTDDRSFSTCRPPGLPLIFAHTVSSSPTVLSTLYSVNACTSFRTWLRLPPLTLKVGFSDFPYVPIVTQCLRVLLRLSLIWKWHLTLSFSPGRLRSLKVGI